MAEQLVKDTPGIKWDDVQWSSVSAGGDSAGRDDILALLDRLKLASDEAGDGLGALPVYDGEDECFAKDGSGLEESFGPDCPGASPPLLSSSRPRRPRA